MKISEYLDKSAVDNVKEALDLAKKYQDYNVVIELIEERALERALVVDRGEISGRLKGVPFMVKDNFLTLGSATTAASKILEGFQSPIQAAAVDKLEAEGAICIGKVNLDAFGHGGSTENSAFGPTKNAIDPTKVAGGSSGGSAVAIALEIVPFALGTDTGGSIRQPASFNGVVGLKPTYGAVSRFGVVAMASSTDTVGCIASDTDDVETVMSIISGQDERDMTTLDDFWGSEPESSGKKIGLIKQFMTDDVDEGVRQAVLGYADKLRSLDYQVEEVDLPMAKYSLPIYYIVMSAEVASNMSRYDGVHFGRRAKNAKSLDDIYKKSRSEGLELENKRRIMVGNFVLSSKSYEAYYLKAQKARTLLIGELKDALSRFDVLLSPVSPATAPQIGENTKDPVKAYLADQMTALASLAGLPALSVPAGVDKNDMPVGVQLVGRQMSDRLLLDIAKQAGES